MGQAADCHDCVLFPCVRMCGMSAHVFVNHMYPPHNENVIHMKAGRPCNSSLNPSSLSPRTCILTHSASRLLSANIFASPAQMSVLTPTYVSLPPEWPSLPHLCSASATFITTVVFQMNTDMWCSHRLYEMNCIGLQLM